jgi:uncharacterized protein (TIGR02231 family)
MLTWALLAATAHATDYEQAAKASMNLDFDWEAVEAQLDRAPAPAAAPAASAPYWPALPALPLEPNSTLDAVTVFRDRALVTRTLDAKVQKGSNTVTFEGLPLGIRSDALQASVVSGSARIVGVTLVSGTSPEDERERREAITAQMRPLLDELGDVQDRIESLLTQRDYLRSTLLAPPSGDRPQPGVADVRGMLTFLGDAERDLASRIRAEQVTAERLGEALHPLLVKLGDPLATGQSVSIDLEATASGEVALGLRYQVDGARWWPSYNARLDEQDGRVTLEYSGIVSQRTGEPWTDVTLSLSTANPTVSGDLPALDAWYLGRDDGGFNMSGGRVDELLNPSQTVTVARPATEGSLEGAKKSGGTVVFEVTGRREVPGDGSEQRIPIGSQSFASTLELSTVPKLVPEVYRRARLVYDGDAPLLPGAVSTYVDADLVGSGALATVVPGEELKLSFGTDDRFRVTRQLVSRTTELVGGKKNVRYTFDFRISVQSFADAPIEVLVTDQLPVSELERVTVEAIDVGQVLPPQPDDPPGMLRWRPTLAPGEKITLPLRFSVTFPREEEHRVQQALDAMY